jgi:hypothetical protein
MAFRTKQLIQFADNTGNLDAFERLRVSNPQGLFDSQFTYDLHPLIFEQITNGSGATVAHDATNRNAVMTFSSTPTGGKAFMQGYECIRYQPGKSQIIRITFNFNEAKANALKFASLSDGTNGYEFQLNGATKRFVIYSGTAVGNQIVNQQDWNLDRLDGSGATGINPSGLTLDITKSNHLVIDFEALYVGRARMGFDIGGHIVYCHEFQFANTGTNQYIQSANLPVRVGMTCTGTVSTTMIFHCCTVISEGGQEKTSGYEFSAEGTATAASGARTHILSLRPKTTFNGIANRVSVGFLEVDVLVTGANPILWELCLGQAISGTTTFTDVNTTYSASEFNTVGTISGNPSIVFDAGYVPASNQAKGASSMMLTHRYPITIDAAGAVRALGTLSLIATGIGGASACRASVKFNEIR